MDRSRQATVPDVWPSMKPIHDLILREIDRTHFTPELTDLVAAVKRERPEVPLVAITRAVGEMVAAGILWPIGGIERADLGPLTQPMRRIED
ncbi:MAG: hypothetical protein JHC70_23875 [Rhodococcus sp.]|nr:hypothetical protein [Rhodococcus sp. (in: high G+C Gram-positive bacteria)]MBJ7325367.1 hypothetical protein [Rhodococcus sp. (in: high G+C Gram-positive bacteria)]